MSEPPSLSAGFISLNHQVLVFTQCGGVQ